MIKKVYGPYISKQDGRRRVVIIYVDKTRTTQSYAKYLYEKQFGPIPQGLDVDHIDENFENDDVNNFQLLTRIENVKKAWETGTNKPKEWFYGVCSECKTEFKKELRNVKGNWKKGTKGPFCSRTCAGNYNQKLRKRDPAYPNWQRN
jgi:hypothetical protein